MFSILLLHISSAKTFSSTGYQAIPISDQETLNFQFSNTNDYDIVVAFSKSGSWRTSDGDLQPVYKNPTSLTVSSSSETTLYFTIFKISTSKCTSVDVIIDGPTNRTYLASANTLENNKKYCFLFHYMNEMEFTLYRSSITENADQLKYSTTCTVQITNIFSSVQLPIKATSILTIIETDYQLITASTVMGVKQVTGTNIFQTGLKSVDGYTTFLANHAPYVFSATNLNYGIKSLTVGPLIQEFSVPAGYVLVFPDAPNSIQGTAKVDTKTLTILGNTLIKSIQFINSGTLSLSTSSGVENIHMVVFNDVLPNCDEYIIANNAKFKVHTSRGVSTCIYIATVDGKTKVDIDDDDYHIPTYRTSGDAYFLSQPYEFPVQFFVYGTSTKIKFEAKDDNKKSYDLLIRDGKNDYKLYSISSSGAQNLNKKSPVPEPRGPMYIGIIIGLLVVICIIVAICVYCCCCICSAKTYSSSSSSSSRNHNNAEVPASTEPPGQTQTYQQWNQNQQQQASTSPYAPSYQPPYSAAPPSYPSPYSDQPAAYPPTYNGHAAGGAPPPAYPNQFENPYA